MEEWVGQLWHRGVSRLAYDRYPHAAVTLEEMKVSIGMLFRAGGGMQHVRLAPASLRRVGGKGTWLQRLAGTQGRADTGWLEPEVLALPSRLDVFADRRLNRDLYLWLAMLSAHFTSSANWIASNCQATTLALSHFPGFQRRHRNLLNAHLDQRRSKATEPGLSALEEAVRHALHHGSPSLDADANARACAGLLNPVWLWIDATSASAAGMAVADGMPESSNQPERNSVTDATRRKTRPIANEQSRAPLVMPFRAEALMSWSEMVKLNRATDDEEDGNAQRAANDMDQISVAPDGQSLASRVRFDLDLPSSTEDDRPLGPGQKFPEWNYRSNQLQPAHCLVQVRQTRAAAPHTPHAALRAAAKTVRRQLETLRAAPGLLHGQDNGDDIDLDAWVRLQADTLGQQGMRNESPAVYARRSHQHRSLCTLLLADLSLSTDAYATQDSKVIDVIRDSLFVFGEALQAVGDPFAIWGFSSVRRHHVRMQHLKAFMDPWGEDARARVGAIRPGYYTRMGAAIRHATLELRDRPERQKLLLILTDGKPNDLDHYEGRYGLEDTRHAIQESRSAGAVPFCLTIDETAHDYLPMLFGSKGYHLVHRPQELARILTRTWAQLAS